MLLYGSAFFLKDSGAGCRGVSEMGGLWNGFPRAMLLNDMGLWMLSRLP